MDFKETSYDITLAGGVAASTRVWAMPVGEPVQDVSVTLNTRGGVTAAVGNITWNVYYGGHFEGDDPYAAGATHVGGALQGNNVIAGPVEIADVVFMGRVILPSNLLKTSYTAAGVPKRGGRGGFPVVLEVINNTAVAVDLTATFVFRNVALP